MERRPLPPGIRAVVLALVLAAPVPTGCDRAAPELDGTRYHRTWSDLHGSVEGDFRVSAWTVAPGSELEVRYDLEVELGERAARTVAEQVTGVWLVWAGERIFDETGHYRQMANGLMSTTLTTTGIAVESNYAVLPSRAAGHFYGTPFDFAEYVPIDEARAGKGLKLRGSWTRTLDDTVPQGDYRLLFDLVFETRDFGREPWGTISFLGEREPRLIDASTYDPRTVTALTEAFYPRRSLPTVRVGSVATPRLPWVLLPELGPNAGEGIVAREDRERFALSTRVRYPSRKILPAGPRELAPVLISAFPRLATTGNSEGAGLVPAEIDHHLDFETGEASASVHAPDGTVHELGTKRFVGKRAGGPLLEGGDFRFDFDRPGRYEVRMAGFIQDRLGRRIEGGGTYELWIGRWLTFSTTVKHGLGFPVGAGFPFKMEIHPAVPADVRITVDYFPMSDPARKRTTVVEGRANSFGYFYAKPDQRLVFDEPGEYRVDHYASFTDARGEHWIGSQTAAGVVVPPEPRVRMHGMRQPAGRPGVVDASDVHFGLSARYRGGEESSKTLSFLEMVDCHDRMLPFHSGDVLYTSSTFSRNGHIAAYLSMEPREPELRARLAAAFRPSPLFDPIGVDHRELAADRPSPLRLEELLDVLHLVGDDERADMFPVLSVNRDGYHPALFPDGNTIEAYTYLSAIRPGFSAFVLASQGAPAGAYWGISPNPFGGQLSAGVNGDVENDIYLVRGGLVVKDLEHGTVDYDAYQSTIVISPNETNDTRVIRPGVDPLFEVNGQPQWITLGMASNVVLEVGDRISLSSSSIPPVPADVETTMTWPDGRELALSGPASEQGFFVRPPVTVDQPGVYRVKALATYAGHTGDVLGSGDGVFHHYVVEKDRPRILSVDLPPVAPYDVERVLTLPIRVDERYRDARLTYSILMPGMIMDEGEMTLERPVHPFRFIASQYAMQFPNFDATSFGWNRPHLNDLVVIVLFVEATAPDGRTVHDARRVVLRGDRLYNLAPQDPADGPSPAAATTVASGPARRGASAPGPGA